MREKNLEGLTKIDDFLSEGEQKAVALSDFFAELSMPHNKKAPVVFDDPATSFDHERKEKIAKRIVDESGLRQAIVFTHDLMFASNIHDLVLNNSNSIDSNKAIFHDMSTEGGRVGIVTENYYPGSVKLENYLPKIQTKITNAEQLSGEEKVDAIKSVYGMLRKAVEKIVEERIFGGIITRWSDHIQLLNELKATLDKTKLQKARDLHGEFSQYIEAHNQSNEMIQQSTPNISKLKTDFDSVKELAQRSS
jgi:wobble nucleotide-excising tRNase